MGCPNDCVFCNQRKITGHETGVMPEEIASFIESCLETVNADIVEVAFFGGSFTGLSLDLQEAYLKIANGYKQTGKIQRIRLSTRPDYISDAVINLLKQYEVDLVELGVQSFDQTVLTLSQRGHSVAAVYEAVERLNDSHIEVGIQLMVGLPGDTPEKFFFSVEETTRLKPVCVRIYPVLVLEDTLLAQQFREGFFEPLTLEQAVALTAQVYRIFYKNQIDVIRMGLQRSEAISKDGSVIAGPFHDAFKDLVLDLMVYEAISEVIQFENNEECANNDESLGLIEVTIHPKRVSHVRGTRKANEAKYKKMMTNYQLKIHKEMAMALDCVTVKYRNSEKTVNFMNQFGVEACT